MLAARHRTVKLTSVQLCIWREDTEKLGVGECNHFHDVRKIIRVGTATHSRHGEALCIAGIRPAGKPARLPCADAYRPAGPSAWLAEEHGDLLKMEKRLRRHTSPRWESLEYGLLCGPDSVVDGKIRDRMLISRDPAKTSRASRFHAKP